MNSIVIGFVILGIMTVGVLVFIVTNAGKEAERARQKREAAAQPKPSPSPAGQANDGSASDG